jgi:AraC-like DNA-binding protein
MDERRHPDDLGFYGEVMPVERPCMAESAWAGALLSEIVRRTPLVGANATAWEGLSCYRFDSPQAQQWDEVNSPALGFVLQGRKRLVTDHGELVYDPFNYFVLTAGMRFQAEIVNASPQKPFLSVLLRLDSSVVQDVLADINSGNPTIYQGSTIRVREAFVSPLDEKVSSTLHRFFDVIDTDADKRVLGSLHLRELVYRVLRSELCGRLADAASRESENNPVSAAIRYMREHLSEPMSVADLAQLVAMSQSAFAHLFKSTSGVSPHQFLKRLRMGEARVMLVKNRSVSEVSIAVGYSSLSHFIYEFKRYFGVTPGAYADAMREVVPLAIASSTLQ